MIEKIDYESVSGEQETAIVNELKKLLRDVVLENGFYSGNEKPRYFAVYALLELAAEVAMKDASNITDFFINAAHEVDDVFTRDPKRFLNY